MSNSGSLDAERRKDHPGGSVPAGVRLREAHCHLLPMGRAATMIDVGSANTFEGQLELVRAGAESVPPGAWVLARGARAVDWSRQPEPGARLERAAGGRPCVVWAFDHHHLLAGPCAWRAAGIDVEGRTDDPPHGKIMRDEAGRPTGVMLERAAYALWSAVPDPGKDGAMSYLRRATAQLAAYGYDEAHDMLASDTLGPMLRELDDAGELAVSCRLYVPLDRLAHMAAGAAEWETPRVRLAGGKLFADGTLTARTAWTLTPYADGLPDRPHGEPMLSADEIAAGIERCAALGLHLAVHAIGDGAVRACLDGAERAARAGAKARGAHGRWMEAEVLLGTARRAGIRIEHAELIAPEDVARFAALGVPASVQPCHLLPDDATLRRALPDALDRVLPLRSLIESGAEPGRLLVFGSDAPIVSSDPCDSVRAAVDDRNRLPGGNAMPQSALTPQECWAAFGAAWR